MNYKLKTFTDTHTFWEAIITSFNETKPKSETFNVVASGGSATQIFDQDLDLKNTKIFIADERFVPEDHDDSNAKGLRSKDLEGKLTSWDATQFDSSQDCAEAYTKKLPAHFDCTILGVGPDGHTASLFPHIPALDTDETKCVATETNVFAVKERMSMTFPLLAQSKKIIILMIGKGKKEILETITDKNADFHDYPARRILDFENVEIYFLDI